MGLTDQLIRAWQAGGIKSITQPYAPLHSWFWTPEGSMDTSGVGDGSANSAVFALLSRKAKSFAEAVPRVYQRVDGQSEEISPHPLTDLLAQPNPYMVGELMWGYVTTATDVDGDAYLFKVRSAAGRVVELWPLIPSYVTAEDEHGSLAVAEDAGKLIAYYEYSPQGFPQRLETADVVHLRASIDPTNHRKGQAPLQTVLREVLTDEQAGQFSAALLKNMGVPGVIISPKDPNDPGPSSAEAERMAAQYRDKFGGSKRGEPYFVRGGAVDVNVVSFTPEQMNFHSLRRVPEERFSAVLGVPAILAHLGAGLDRATYSNAETLREMFVEDTLAPLWRIFGAQITGQLLADFDSTTGRSVQFDLSDVRALQTDEDALWTRLNVGVQGGWVSVADARRAAGLGVQPSDEVFLRPVSTVEQAVGVTPEPEVLPGQLSAVSA